ERPQRLNRHIMIHRADRGTGARDQGSRVASEANHHHHRGRRLLRKSEKYFRHWLSVQSHLAYIPDNAYDLIKRAFHIGTAHLDRLTDPPSRSRPPLAGDLFIDPRNMHSLFVILVVETAASHQPHPHGVEISAVRRIEQAKRNVASSRR